VVCAGAEVALPALPPLSLFDDGRLSLWHEFARAARRERQLTWDELDARKIAEDRLRELVAHANALSSEQQRRAALEQEYERVLAEVRAELARTQGEFRREAAAHSETQRRLAYRETLPGWLRWPLGVARRRLVARS
jgi:hypothetical protein